MGQLRYRYPLNISSDGISLDFLIENSLPLFGSHSTFLCLLCCCYYFLFYILVICIHACTFFWILYSFTKTTSYSSLIPPLNVHLWEHSAGINLLDKLKYTNVIVYLGGHKKTYEAITSLNHINLKQTDPFGAVCIFIFVE